MFKRVTNRLHDRIGLLVTAAAGLILLLVGLSWTVTTRSAIEEEINAATRVAEQWMTVLVDEAEARGDTAQLTDQLAAVGRVRANSLEVFDSEGRLRYRSPASTYKAGRDAPPWFAALVSPHFEPSVREVDGLRLVLVPDGSRATLDAWDDLVQVAGWAIALLVLLGLAVRHAIDRTLQPLHALESALEQTADGRFDVRLPSYGLAELDRLADRYNRMADELDSSLQRNARLEEDQAFNQALQARLEEERRQIARELHDEIGQSVTAVRAMAGAIAQRSGDVPGVHGSAQAILAMTGQMQDGVRHILARLRRPEPLPRGRLAAALVEYCDHWASLYPDIVIEQSIGTEPVALPEDYCLAVLRILQESLTNVARHANATRVEVAAACDDAQLILRICDDGEGFSSQAAANRFGLTGMRERVQALGGKLGLEASPHGGAMVTALLPLPQAPAMPMPARKAIPHQDNGDRP
ncbi:MAG: HAMP domain-containing protein [Rhodocyclaceae bacterium]|nr:HAMP domain-containing protein [Rhodocyclaceae bacterium]